MDATEVLINIRKIVRSINLESKKIEKKYGVSIPQVLCLNFLRQSKDCQATQGDIKTFLNLNPSTVSGIIQRLEKKNLIARLPKIGDKRVAKYVLTASGERLLVSIPSLLQDQLTTKLNNIDDLELKSIQTALNRLVDIMQIKNIEPLPELTDDEVI
jgi:DNA-binding MarR family transcriptional regulator